MSVDFRAMRTFEEWDKGDTLHGLAITLTKSMRDELTALQDHIQARMCNNHEAQDLCFKNVTAAMDFWESYIQMFTGFDDKLLTKVCEGGSAPRP